MHLILESVEVIDSSRFDALPHASGECGKEEKDTTTGLGFDLLTTTTGCCCYHVTAILPQSSLEN